MADVVDQGQRFGEFGIEAERGGKGAGDLGDFKRVGKAVAEVVGLWFRLRVGLGFGREAGEDLGFAGETAEGAGVKDTGGVAGEGSAIGMGRLGMVAMGEWCSGQALVMLSTGNCPHSIPAPIYDITRREAFTIPARAHA